MHTIRMCKHFNYLFEEIFNIRYIYIASINFKLYIFSYLSYQYMTMKALLWGQIFIIIS